MAFSSARFRRRLVRGLALALCGALAACQAGCVQRRMTIRSNPPGAQVYVDDYEVGTTPVATHFTYYGIRKIRLVKDGYETLTVMQPVGAPWYQIPPIDFVAENVIPWEIRDERDFCYDLTPQRVVPTEELLSRAEDLRRGIHPLTGVAPQTPSWAQPPQAPLWAPPPGTVAPQPAPPPFRPAPTAEPIPAPQPGTDGWQLHSVPPM
jgi:hypothetical protein